MLRIKLPSAAVCCCWKTSRTPSCSWRYIAFHLDFSQIHSFMTSHLMQSKILVKIPKGAYLCNFGSADNWGMYIMGNPFRKVYISARLPNEKISRGSTGLFVVLTMHIFEGLWFPVVPHPQGTAL